MAIPCVLESSVRGTKFYSAMQVILGTQYAGEMKKGVFTVMHYFMPKQGILSLHSGCNVGAANDVSLFFGLSGARAVARRRAVADGQMLTARQASTLQRKAVQKLQASKGMRCQREALL